MSTLNEEDRANLAAFLDGELDEEATQALEAKLSVDPEARQEVDALRQAWSMLDYLPRPEPSPNFTHRTMERLALGTRAVETAKMPRPRTFRWGSVAAWTAAVALALVFGATVGNYFWRSEQEEPNMSQRRIIENLKLYENLDDFDFLKQLDQPELFGEEVGS